MEYVNDYAGLKALANQPLVSILAVLLSCCVSLNKSLHLFESCVFCRRETLKGDLEETMYGKLPQEATVDIQRTVKHWNNLIRGGCTSTFHGIISSYS